MDEGLHLDPMTVLYGYGMCRLEPQWVRHLLGTHIPSDASHSRQMDNILLQQPLMGYGCGTLWLEQQ